MIINEEVRNRIKVAAAAYAYEIENDPIMTDAEFDSLCLKIKPDVVTGSILLDTFFKTEFDPNTGSWIHKHPDLRELPKLVAFIRELRK